MTKSEAGRLGGQALVAKYGTSYMAQIGSKGFWATITVLSDRQQLPVEYRGNCFRNLLANLKARKAEK